MFSFWSRGSNDIEVAVKASASHDPTEKNDEKAGIRNAATTASSLRRRSWKTSFDDICFQRGTLCTTINQVLEEFEVDAREIPTASMVAFANHESAHENLVERFQAEINPRLNKEDKEKKIAMGSTIYRTAVGVASFGYSMSKVLWQSPEDLLMERYGNVDEKPGEDEFSRFDAEVAEDQVIMNTELALECLILIRDTILRCIPPQQGVIRLPGGAPTAGPVLQGLVGKALAEECFSQNRVESLIQKLSSKDFQTLLRVLLDCSIVEILKRRPKQEDLLLISLNSQSSSKEYLLAMHDLTVQIENIQNRIGRLIQKGDACKLEALRAKKRKQISQATQQLRLAKRFEEEITLCQNTVHNLESQKLAIESATSTREILQLSQQTAQTLKNLREENAESITLDLQEELDNLKEVQETFSLSANQGYTVDEDELLLELENLTLEHAEITSTLEPTSGSTVHPNESALLPAHETQQVSWPARTGDILDVESPAKDASAGKVAIS